MPGALSARGLSTDPQCHLPHRLGEARWVLVLCSCLVALMDQSVNTLGFWPVWRPILSSDSVKWPQAWSRCLAELMLSGLGLIFLTRIFYSATHPIFFSSALRSSTCRVSRVGPDLVYKLTLVCFSFTGRAFVVGTSESLLALRTVTSKVKSALTLALCLSVFRACIIRLD